MDVIDCQEMSIIRKIEKSALIRPGYKQLILLSSIICAKNVSDKGGYPLRIQYSRVFYRNWSLLVARPECD